MTSIALFANRNQHLHQPRREFKSGGWIDPHERADRYEVVLKALTDAGLQVRPSVAVDESAIERIHDPDYLAFLRSVHKTWMDAGRDGDVFPLVWPSGMRPDAPVRGLDGLIGRHAFDVDTPITAGSWQAAHGGAVAVLNGAQGLLAGDNGLVLTRPPGHHAMRAHYGGYCFLNNAAIAAQRLLDQGLERVAVLDVDYHHGNGTQEIFYRRKDVLVVNIHADPAHEYPCFLGYADERGIAEGVGFNLNLPLPAGTEWETYSQVLETACDQIVRFQADAIVLSFGADTFQDDPLGTFGLCISDYREMGRCIARCRLPFLVVTEGGYAVSALGKIVVSLLEGLSEG